MRLVFRCQFRMDDSVAQAPNRSRRRRGRRRPYHGVRSPGRSCGMSVHSHQMHEVGFGFPEIRRAPGTDSAAPAAADRGLRRTGGKGPAAGCAEDCALDRAGRVPQGDKKRCRRMSQNQTRLRSLAQSQSERRTGRPQVATWSVGGSSGNSSPRRWSPVLCGICSK